MISTLSFYVSVHIVIPNICDFGAAILSIEAYRPIIRMRFPYTTAMILLQTHSNILPSEYFCL